MIPSLDYPPEPMDWRRVCAGLGFPALPELEPLGLLVAYAGGQWKLLTGLAVLLLRGWNFTVGCDLKTRLFTAHACRTPGTGPGRRFHVSSLDREAWQALWIVLDNVLFWEGQQARVGRS